MADTLLAKGQLAASVGTLYTVPSATTTGLKMIVLHNTGTTNQQVQVFIDGTTTADKVLDIFLAPLETVTWAIEYPVMLATADTLQGLAGSGATVNYFLYGRES